ncbi:anion transporter [Candidatus Woesearchaeota archaeon]|nr:anion transporter [Candidatus Woesearchaeota archaeon]
MLIPIIVLFLVFILIAIRQIGSLRLQIWQIMLFGALAVLITRQITLVEALNSINLDILLFLFGMFIIGYALEESGYLSYISYKIFKKAKSADMLLLIILFSAGIASAFLMNDTLAIIGTPIVLMLAKKHNIQSKPLLLALAFAITTGSVMSPIGNPQNLLIAINGNVKNPFVTFLRYLFIPTMINLFLAFVLLKFFYKEQLKNVLSENYQEEIKDSKLAKLCKLSFILIIILIIVKIIFISLNLGIDFRLTYIALIAAFPVIALSEKRIRIIKNVDWHTIIFFSAMFILMQSVWNSGFFQMAISNLNIVSTEMILAISIVLSQLISNVPLVALYLPILTHNGALTKGMMALAAGSTIAGNLFILGAASNVIVIQNAEKKANETLTFFEFAKIGVPLTVINSIIYWLFLS